ncbi:insulinase family protein [Pseudomonas asiatica]|uniref:M16 family metallopeptidase n=1 Tax=Pseudomonas TaxID=286 RepID=UPI00209AB04E|nr:MULTISPECIES: pitrilysin family protein [Pseudomonas]MCO7523327.1 insulinase family protein [Pseudomonas asiatica]MDH4433892.1 pitrilysin family protein [Pseudomonas shirazica]
MTHHPAPPAPAGSVHSFTLANGLRVYLREDNRAPLVSVQLWYHVGSSYEPEGHTGLSHALEHLLFEGSSKLAPGQYSALMSRLGGDPNAFTYADATVFPLTLPRNRLEIALEAMADVMASATLSEVPFARELAVVMAERREDIDNSPLALAVEHHQLLAYGNSGYGTPVTGHKTDLGHMTPAAARTWYQTWYHPNNATLAVAGDIALAQLQKLVTRHFAAIPANRLPTRQTPIKPSGQVRRSQTLRWHGLYTGVIISFNLPSQCTASSGSHACALRLLPDILAEGHSSTLQRLLVQDTPLLQGLRATYEPWQRGDSLLTLYAFCSPQVTPEAAAERLMLEIEAFRQSAPSKEDLQRAKARLLARQLFERDDIGKQAEAIGKQAACGLDPVALDDERQAIEAVTAEQVGLVALEFLTDARAAITFMHHKESTDE